MRIIVSNKTPFISLKKYKNLPKVQNFRKVTIQLITIYFCEVSFSLRVI